MKVAVVGGGLFGCTAAIHAARAGHEVHLFEARRALMQAASGCSYYRLHRGYHYPRSAETGREGRRAEALFRSEYGACVVDGGRQFYVVPNDDRSHVTAREFATFLDNEGLPFSEVEDMPFNGGAFQVQEPRIDMSSMQALVRQKIADSGVYVHLSTVPVISLRYEFDKIVVAAYADTNGTLEDLGCATQTYKFQVVEKPVVMLPPSFEGVSIVVVDGPFGCVDPMDDTPLHVLGHVRHTVHAENVGAAPDIPSHLRAMLHNGIIRTPRPTRFGEVVEDLRRYVPGVAKAFHVGSVFVLRAVLAHQEATDCRPTLVEPIDHQVVKIFSGKLGTAVRAARDALELIGGHARVAA